MSRARTGSCDRDALCFDSKLCPFQSPHHIILPAFAVATDIQPSYIVCNNEDAKRAEMREVLRQFCSIGILPVAIP